MHLFRVSEPQGSSRAPLEPGLVFELEEDRARVPLVRVDDTEFCIPIDAALSHGASLAKAVGRQPIKDRYNRTIGWKEPAIYRADYISENDSICLTTDRGDAPRDALVILDTAPGIGGSLRLTANTMSDALIRKKGFDEVVREWNAFPPLGVTLLNPEHVEIDNAGNCRWHPDWSFEVPPPVVLRMMPGACFRVFRTGDVGDAAAVFLVSWREEEDRDLGERVLRLYTVIPRNQEMAR